MKRKPMSNKQSQRVFTAGAMKVHPMNTRPAPQRGGLRL
jgi:hypothetical protein